MRTAAMNLPKLHIANSNKMDIASALRDALLAAREQNRMTCGVYESGKVLEKDPENVMMCILPHSSSIDVTLHIHLTLIEAFCWENEIRLLKVDSSEKLAKLLGNAKPQRPVNDNDIAAGRLPSAWPSSTEDFNCILVEYPQDEASEAEEDVVEYCKLTADIAPQPVIELEEVAV